MTENSESRISADLRLVAPGHEHCGFREEDTMTPCLEKAVVHITLTSGENKDTSIFMCAAHSEEAKEEWLDTTLREGWKQ